MGCRDIVSDGLNLPRECGEFVFALGTLGFINPAPVPMREAPKGYNDVGYS